jgi:hypothetical protein
MATSDAPTAEARPQRIQAQATRVRNMSPSRRRRPVARAARLENTNNNAAGNSRIRPPLRGWPTRAEVHHTLLGATALMVLSPREFRSLDDLVDYQPLIIVKVRAAVAGALACERLGELIDAGATVVLAAQNRDAAGSLRKIAQRAMVRWTKIEGSA